MEEFKIIAKKINSRIEELRRDKHIDNEKRMFLIKENEKFLVIINNVYYIEFGKTLNI